MIEWDEDDALCEYRVCTMPCTIWVSYTSKLTALGKGCLINYTAIDQVALMGLGEPHCSNVNAHNKDC